MHVCTKYSIQIRTGPNSGPNGTLHTRPNTATMWNPNTDSC